ncbi:glucans biosynthesis glucosyltransferase MdoH [Phenylobacterium sp. J367]|uniref:glucans biosynthesis glucosyltransferase MdoH n=1 Tax=Phenylobacterium sp. J367 TaxID=2898435 RepID=UPI002151EEDD|nr:glucans biosynthesis glucosyltransferase MdoH [Phenylobacterium sp. J367]MCR5879433.1 glucans biosynthesis glucosyltransferase MdoH [Phenylobacterium sp. J367]
MSILAGRLAEPLETAELDSQPWLPVEAPLAMPRQDFNAESPAIAEVMVTSPADIGLRRMALAAGTLLFTLLVAIAPYVLYARKGFEPFEVLGLGVFLLLVTPLSCWFCSALFGFFNILKGQEQDDLAFSPRPAHPTTRTALLMPLCNEDASAAFARLAGIDASLARLGVSDSFDFFVLSDSNNRVAPAEEAAFLAFRAHAHSRIFMRRRTENLERKAGNIADWVSRFGGAYECMIILDADSTLAGETVLRLVDAMERNPTIGLIQTAPVIVGAQTLFARVSQFSVRMYGKVAAAGYAWWTGAESSYWGHNAIVRTGAFAACARLPILPGEKPFGGDVLSHDVVEAALLRRAGWAVHVTAALDGSCEETPPTILDFIRREHRWCQGNLQHLRLLTARGPAPYEPPSARHGRDGLPVLAPVVHGARHRPGAAAAASDQLGLALVLPGSRVQPLHAGLADRRRPADRPQDHGRGHRPDAPARAPRLRRRPRRGEERRHRDRAVGPGRPDPDGRQRQRRDPDPARP